MLSAKTDIVIIGGGIAGLFILNHLRKQGYQAILLEKNALGFGQTIASQGIIHGGIKYALSGEVSNSSLHISDMPRVWQACLQGQGGLDLSAVKLLSPHYYLCSQQKITQRVTQFFAQKALCSDSDALNPADYPEFFQTKQFSGLLTRVHECVLDVPSLINALAQNMLPFIFKVSDCLLQKDKGEYAVIITNESNESLMLNASQIILTAGEGNHQLFPAAPMQTRPLHMVMLAADNLPAIFVHCVTLSTNPVLTITSHMTHTGKPIWYLGGQIAEEGIHRDKASQINAAQALITQQFPWFTPQNPRWETLSINRAEGENGGKRPESIMIARQDNVIMAWPTKLTFAPLLAEKIIPLLQQPSTPYPLELLATWPKPSLATSPWDHIA